jgi:predicted lipoprotein with Yx(FWY)xxD motif
MRHPKIIISGMALAAVAAVGGITAASATSSPSAASSPPAASSPSASPSGAATVRTASVTVGGKTETILINGHGLPLYFYKPDTAAKSLVSGTLAQLWPPLTSAAPAAAGLSGKVTVVMDSHGDQVTYNGHPLYTFADDHAGQVTGQGVQDFFLATPGLAAISTSPTSGTAPAAPSGGIGY